MKYLLHELLTLSLNERLLIIEEIITIPPSDEITITFESNQASTFSLKNIEIEAK